MKWNIKKSTAFVVALMFLIGGVLVPANGLPEENEFSIAEKIKSFMLVNNPEALEGVRESNENCMQDAIEINAEYYRQIGRYSELEKYKQFLQESAVLVPEDSFCFYPLITDRYAKQYADDFAYDSLIDSKKIWTIPAKDIGLSKYCYEDKFGEYESLTKVFDQKTIDFLKEPEKIEQMVKEQVSEEIVDCKIVMTGYTRMVVEQGRPDVVYPTTGNWLQFFI